ncbi:hypothetical protein QBC40DRAFT_297494 [Triangularia verruculosa]|uniref:Uncharacterized protein n=1 Tax=Triangularia verruculosa TaxID=2587418 RepID=A0AAN6XG39_9PEZI|nr:hypothetical protein QBC40DRAFT_297494 [Triangularia verruculosa]
MRAIGLGIFTKVLRRLEPAKYLIRKSRRVALARSAVHILPASVSIALVYVNLSGLFIGRELDGPERQNSLKMALLQVAAKLWDASNHGWTGRSDYYDAENNGLAGGGKYVLAEWIPAGLISLSTGMSEDIIVKSLRLEDVSVAQIMHWASSRETTRSEDLAYCLMGLFDINMPLLYGEGEKKAFIRLQQEILKSTDDHSIFLWILPEDKSRQRKYWGLLAESPTWFANSRGIMTAIHCQPDGDLVIASIMTNRGLFVGFSGVMLPKHSPGIQDV